MLLKVLIVIVVILAIALGLLYYFGNKMQKRQVEQQALMEQMAQNVTMLVIDKKKLKIKESGLPQQVIDQVPWYAKRSKVPLVKAKIGPRIMTLMCEESVFEVLPVKTEVKAVISGIYITSIKSIRGSIVPKPQKKSFFDRFRKKDK